MAAPAAKKAMCTTSARAANIKIAGATPTTSAHLPDAPTDPKNEFNKTVATNGAVHDRLAPNPGANRASIRVAPTVSKVTAIVEVPGTGDEIAIVLPTKQTRLPIPRRENVSEALVRKALHPAPGAGGWFAPMVPWGGSSRALGVLCPCDLCTATKNEKYTLMRKMSAAARAPKSEEPPTLVAPINPTTDATAKRLTPPPTYVAVTAPAIWAAVPRGSAKARPPHVIATRKEAATPTTDPSAPMRKHSPTRSIGPADPRERAAVGFPAGSKSEFRFCFSSTTGFPRMMMASDNGRRWDQQRSYSLCFAGTRPKLLEKKNNRRNGGGGCLDVGMLFTS